MSRARFAAVPHHQSHAPTPVCMLSCAEPPSFDKLSWPLSDPSGKLGPAVCGREAANEQQVEHLRQFRQDHMCTSKPVTCTHKHGSAASDLPIVTDNLALTVLVDTGTDYLLVRSAITKDRKKALTDRSGPEIRTAGGRLITPVSRCAAGVLIHGFVLVRDFVVRPQCSREITLGLDFLQANGAVIDSEKSRVTFWRAPIHCKSRHGRVAGGRPAHCC